jgi:hypothetical protein
MKAMNLKDEIKSKYGEAAGQVISGQVRSCCAPSCCGEMRSLHRRMLVTSNLYEQDQKSELPPEAVLASLGCGNPTALAQLNLGEVV